MAYKLLDLFCCAGGAAYGYHQAGFEVTGIDNVPQKRYPYRFIQADALEYVAEHGHEYDAIHASPPCQAYSILTGSKHRDKHQELIIPVRKLLISSGKPYVMENVAGARKLLVNPVMLCGSVFGLPIHRHRYFELSWTQLIMVSKCKHDFEPVLISGTTRRQRNGRRVGEYIKSEKAAAIGIDWMIGKELDEAIPPAFTHYLGEHLLQHLNYIHNE